MKNMSIRTKILAGVVLVNLLGAMAVIVYLHESYAGSLDVAAQKSQVLSRAAWQQLMDVGGDELGSLKLNPRDLEFLDRMKDITGADYGLLFDKTAIDAGAYAKMREKAGRPNNWDENETYVLAVVTDEGVADKMRFEAPPGDVPEIGRVVGIENGACSQVCHDNVKGQGDYWGVKWSTDSKSRNHVVFPVSDSDGKVIGVIYGIDDISAQANSAKGSMMRTLLMIALTLVVATIVIGGLLDTLVFRRLSSLILSIEDLSVRVAGGDFDARFVPGGSGDEIGRFEEFFGRFMDLVSATLKSMMNKSA